MSAPKSACNNKGTEREKEREREISRYPWPTDVFPLRSRSLSQRAKDALCVGPAREMYLKDAKADSCHT